MAIMRIAGDAVAMEGERPREPQRDFDPFAAWREMPAGKNLS
jgi:hypothetical protein